MKIVVDEIPDKAYKCLFSKYAKCYHECQLTTGICELDCNRRCEVLLSIKPVKGFTYKGKQLYIMENNNGMDKDT